MKRRTLLEGAASAAVLTLMPAISAAKSAGIPWEKLRRAVDGHLIPLHRTFDWEAMKNPYYIHDHPALTQTLGWADAWTSAPSWYAVEATHAGDIAAAINFAREHGIKIAVRGGGHSYLGTSNAPDSLLAWTRGMDDISVGSKSVTLGTGVLWGQAYEAVTTKAGRYVQGGGCTTVNTGGLVSSGGFGSFSKRYGSAASSLLSAQVVTADGKIRHVDATHDPDLFWALKGGGGGTFGVMTQMELMLHDLTPYGGVASAEISASSDAAYRELIDRFMAFYKESLHNESWGESVTFSRHNRIKIDLVCSGLSGEEIKALWKPFFDAIKASPSKFELQAAPDLAAASQRSWWDLAFFKKYAPDAIKIDPRPGHENSWWWSGDSGQVGVFLYNYESLWIPDSLLADSERSKLVNALFAATRRYGFALHFNKGLAGAPADAIARTLDTATNPNVTTSFALAICADGDQGLFPGLPGHRPDMAKAREAARQISSCINELRSVAPDGGAYVSESGFFETNYGKAYWGTNYPRLQAVKKKYDPHNFFAVRNGVVPLSS